MVMKSYANGTKKKLNMLILEILKNYSDEDYHLTQQEILRKLASDYGEENIDRRTVKSNIESLNDMGFEIESDNGYYLAEREFDDAELRLLIDSVLFSKAIPNAQAKRLIEKLESFGNKYFKSKVSHVRPMPPLKRTENKQTMYSVHAINDAIDANKKITFKYKHYGPDMKLHDTGKEYLVNPYQMLAANGNYYLLANVDKYDNATYFRIDKMSEVDVTNERRKPQKQVKGLENGIDLPKHMAEHIYMFAGNSVTVELKCKNEIIDAVADWFGNDLRVTKRDDDSITITVRCNETAMFYWALQYGPFVEVIGPEDLRNRIRDAVGEMGRKYT